MRKMRMLALVLTLLLLMSTVVTAATVETDKKLDNGKVSIEVIDNADVTTSIAYGFIKDENNNNVKTEQKISVTVESSALAKDEEVLILMCKQKDNGDPDVADGNVYFIDQKKVPAPGGSITFDVYPSFMKDSIIYISGVIDGLLKAVVVDGLVIGDVTGDGKVNIADILAIAKVIKTLKTNPSYEYDTAVNINGDSKVNIADILAVAKIIVNNKKN